MKKIRRSTTSEPNRIVKLLCVDDEPAILEVFQALFTAAYKSVRVYTADNNEDAIKLASKYCPDLILTDINRPGGNGYEFLQLLRAKSRTKYITVFSVSGSVSSGHNKKLKRQAELEELKQYRAGFNRVFPKPFKLDQLLSAVEWFVMGNASPDQALLNLGTESPTLDYKETLDISSRDGLAKVAKDVIAMANSGGGTIIVGVAEKAKGHFEQVGLSPEVLEKLEVSLVNKSLRGFMDTAFHIGVRRVTDGDKTFVFLEVPAAKDLPILAKKKNESASLYQGRLYIRTSAAESREITDSSELRSLLKKFI
jgi:CheY-like chemotaxis protein